MATNVAKLFILSSPSTSSSSPIISRKEIGNSRVSFTTTTTTNKLRCSVSLSCSSNTTQIVGGVAASDFKERPWKEIDARFALEDGTIWKVKSFGAPGTIFSGVAADDTSLDRRPFSDIILITNSSMDDEEIDPNQFRCPEGFVLSSSYISTSNWRHIKCLSNHLVKKGIMGIYGADIDDITWRMKKEIHIEGVISTDDSITDKELIQRVHKSGCSSDSGMPFLTDAGAFILNARGSVGERFHVVVLDVGIKHYILRRLASTGCKVTVVPQFWPPVTILRFKPDGVLLNWPSYYINRPLEAEKIKHIIGRKVPVFRICCLEDDYVKMQLYLPTIDTTSLLYNYPEGSSVGPHDHDSDSGFGEFFKAMERAKPARQMAAKATAFTLNNNNNNKCSSALSPSRERCFKKRPWKETDARFVLEDGSIWKTKSFGAPSSRRLKGSTITSHLVEDKSLLRYPEILTDDNYKTQLVLMTDPNWMEKLEPKTDKESLYEWSKFKGGLVFGSLNVSTSNWRHIRRLRNQFVKAGIMAMYGVDMNEIISRLNKESLENGLMGVMSTDDSITDKELLEMTHRYDLCDVPLESRCLSYDGSFVLNASESVGERFHVVVYDFGIKHYILRRLASTGCKITVVPAYWPASDILKLKPDGVLFDYHPEHSLAYDDCRYSNKRVKYLIGKVPVFRICSLHLFDKNDDDDFCHSIPTIDTISLLYNNPEGRSSLKHNDHDSDSGFGEFLKAMEQAKQAA